MDRFDFRSRGREILVTPGPPPPTPQPDRVAELLRRALLMRDVMREKGWSLRTIARNWGMTPAWACQLMKLTRLAPDIQERVLAMTTTTPSCYLTENKLRLLVACEMDWDRQRERFEKLLAGELRPLRPAPNEPVPPQDPRDENPLAPDIVFRAGRVALEPTPRFDKVSPEVVRVRVRRVQDITETDPGLDLPVETRPAPEPPRVVRQRRKAEARKRPARLPAVALALRRARDYQRMLDTREVASRADLARRLGLTRARVTQVLQLLDLAPEIQAYLDALEPSTDRFPVPEAHLRYIARMADWDEQIEAFECAAGATLPSRRGCSARRVPRDDPSDASGES